jgi:predicted DNA-binding transcriptional regulator YafY
VAERIDRSERLLNLVVAMLGTGRAISRADIRRVIPGYLTTASDAAFERMFERDKDELRSMGIPIETVCDESGDVLGYRIDRQEFGYVDVEFSSAEFQVLGVAAQAWEQAALGPQARNALLKLRPIVADDADLPNISVSFAAHLTASESALLPLLSAVRAQHKVVFPYRAPGATIDTERTVEPWGVLCRSGLWYLIGFDCDRLAQRIFRLGRISGKLVDTSVPSVEPRPDRMQLLKLLNDSLDALTENAEVVAARVVLERPYGAQLLRHAQSVSDGEVGYLILDITGSRPHIMSAIIRALPHVEVLSPADLIHDVRQQIEAVARAHSGAS